MRHKANSLHRIVCLLALGAAICGAAERSDQKGKRDMFGFFDRKKGRKTTTVIAREVGIPLQSHAELPAALPPPASPSFAICKVGFLRGELPAPEWAPREVHGETRRVFVIPANSGQPPLAVLPGSGKRKKVQVWELSDDPAPRFLKQRQVALDPAQESWALAYPESVSCLPANRVAMAIGYHDPAKKLVLFIYTPATNQFRRVDRIESDKSGAPPYQPFEVLAVAPNAALLLYHTEPIRLGPDDFVYQHDHVMLFSPSKPEGLEILKLTIDDGNIRACAIDGKTLWLKTLDRRKPATDHVWSLDLRNVL